MKGAETLFKDMMNKEGLKAEDKKMITETFKWFQFLRNELSLIRLDKSRK